MGRQRERSNSRRCVESKFIAYEKVYPELSAELKRRLAGDYQQIGKKNLKLF